MNCDPAKRGLTVCDTSRLVSQTADRAQLTPNRFRLGPTRSTSDPLELHSTDMCSTAPIKIHSRLILAGPELPLRHPRHPQTPNICTTYFRQSAAPLPFCDIRRPFQPTCKYRRRAASCRWNSSLRNSCSLPVSAAGLLSSNEAFCTAWSRARSLREMAKTLRRSACATTFSSCDT